MTITSLDRLYCCAKILNQIWVKFLGSISNYLFIKIFSLTIHFQDVGLLKFIEHMIYNTVNLARARPIWEISLWQRLWRIIKVKLTWGGEIRFNCGWHPSMCWNLELATKKEQTELQYSSLSAPWPWTKCGQPSQDPATLCFFPWCTTTK